jgi:O-antigen/teichoic acid export membrane protein
VGFPFVAKMSHQPLPEFRKNVLKYRFMVLCAGAFILSVVINAGGPVVLRLYDHRYQAAGWMVPILALGLWHTLMYSTTSDILFSLGKPHYNAIGTGCYCAAMFLGLPLAFHFFGMLGAVVSVAAGDLPIYFVLETGAARQKISVWRQDALATAVFVALVGLGFGLKRLIF